MSGSHGSSRRRAYGRRQKDLRTRRSTSPMADPRGPLDWGGADWVDRPAPLQPWLRMEDARGARGAG